jgi:hypothetical protein
MDALTFISEIVKALAWPTAIVVLVSLLKKPIVELVPLMKKLKYKELELEFSQEVMALKEETTEIRTLEATKAKDLSLTTSKALKKNN